MDCSDNASASAPTPIVAEHDRGHLLRGDAGDDGEC